MDHKHILDIFKDEIEKKSLINLTSKLISINSENPPGDMYNISEFITNLLEENGLRVDKIEPEKGKISLISKLGKPPYLVLNGHMDTVPIGSRTQWKNDPLSGTILNDTIYGRGASDMKAGLAGILYSFILSAKYENDLGYGIMFMAVPDEETGGRYGTKWLLEHTDIYKSAEACIVAEPTEIDNLEIGQKGQMWLKFVSGGESVHGSLSPYMGKNAIVNLFNFLEDLKTITNLTSQPDKNIEEIFERSKKRAIKTLKNSKVSNIIDHVSFNIGKFSGGIKVNIVPDIAEAEIDIRIPIGLNTKVIENYIRDKLGKYDNINMDILGSSEPNYISSDNKIVRTFEYQIKRLLNIEVDKTFQWASSDARYFRYLNIPTVQYGPATIEGIHSYNESVKIKDIINATKVYFGVMFSYT